MPATATTIEAKQCLDPRGGIVASASLLADAVVRRLAEGNVVEIDLTTVRGLSSSYFNVLLQRVLPVTGIDHFADRIKLRYDSAAQELVFNRSFESARRGVA